MRIRARRSVIRERADAPNSRSTPPRDAPSSDTDTDRAISLTTAAMNIVTLKRGKEKSLLRRHPWIYANAIDHVEGRPAPGATVVVRGADGRFLARAAYSPHSAIRLRTWSFDEAEPIDHAFFKRRVQNALAHRRALVSGTGAVRLVFGEAG